GAARARGLLATARLALDTRRRADACQLALHVRHRPAGQFTARGDAAGRRERRDPPADRDMGEPACGAQRARSRRDSCLSVGPELNRRMTDSNDPEILFDRRGTAGIVTLNRPHALNAVTHAMV